MGRTSCACAGRATSSGRSTSSAEPAMASGLRTFQHMVSCHQNHLLLLFLVDIISELGLFVAGGRHPLVCRWRHWWGVRRVQAGLASDRLLVDNLEMSSTHFQRCIFQRQIWYFVTSVRHKTGNLPNDLQLAISTGGREGKIENI